jgi:hypothetical protein
MVRLCSVGKEDMFGPFMLKNFTYKTVSIMVKFLLFLEPSVLFDYQMQAKQKAV